MGSTNTNHRNIVSLLNAKNKDTNNIDSKADVMADWKEKFTKRIHTESKSRKESFTFIDASKKSMYHTERDKVFLSVVSFLKSEPLKDNDYVKFVSCYISTGKKLNTKYFKNNISKLNEYYKKVDEAKSKGETFNPFSLKAYNRYVLFMALKFSGEYTSDLDKAFGVQTVGYREYNPLTNIPSVLRGELPFEVKEYDIKRAFPTFIDIELVKEYRHTVYDILDKKTFSYLLNSNIENTGADRNAILKQLSRVYGKDADKVCTVERFNNKGGAFMEFSKYEKEYIEKFVIENNLINYVRLHDGVFVLAETDCSITHFDKVEFSLKECIKPPIENEIENFYKIDENLKVCTSPMMYANFFIQENFIRISTPDDKIFLLRDTNNVVDFFNHNTDTVSFLKDNINEFGNTFDAVANIIAKENFSVVKQGFYLIPQIELKYYSDTKSTFGLPFKNGFFEFNSIDIVRKEYSDVKGFFAPHKIQSREFKYTDEIGMFEQFLTRVAICREVANTADTVIINREFQKMFGYLCHTYKSQTNAPCIILTDEDANDENRNGGRGKTIVTKAISEVLTTMLKGGNEFDASYTHVFADLEKKHKVYIIDDVPAGFKYDDLYTNILGGISCQRKGLKAELIEFEDSSKFLITSNWVVRYDEKNASTNRRFLEFKFSDYYNQHHTPKDDFECTFFEDWNAEEWSKFYSFVFRCVKLFLADGLTQIPYNKTNDNYLASFNNISMTEEFERIVTILFESEIQFRVNDFLRIYEANDNPLRNQKMFHSKIVKKLIDVWFNKNINEPMTKGWKYVLSDRIWIKCNI